jgi:RNA polymerase sigma-70 factor, ECF subfamily
MNAATHIVEADPDLDERSAWDRCQSGDAQAFGLVVRKYMKQAYFTALGLVGNHEDALDLSQEAFVRAFRARERFDPGQKFFTWYYRILRNLCLNHLRDRARFADLPADESAEGPADALTEYPADPSVLAQRNEMNTALWQAIARLKPEDREIILLREIEGCSYGEIAERLEIPPGTVMSRLFYARHRLKQTLEATL